jgi:uncharacterized membrane protein YkoI
MRRRLIGISATCALIAFAGNYQAQADQVPVAQVPERVLKAIKEHSQGENLEHVERDTKNGQTVYQAEFKRAGLNRRLTFSADGTLLPDRPIGDRVIGFDRTPSMALSDLPAAVQKSVKEQQAGREIVDIDKEVWNGKPVYEVEFKEKGPNSRIHVANDGSMVLNKDRRYAYLGAQLSETPAAVQATVKRTVSSAEVVDVDRESKDGRVVYDVEIKQEGMNRHLKIAADGTLVADSNRRDGTGVGERVRERIGLDRDASTMTLDDTPAAVQKTIREHSGGGALKPIKRETRNGRVQYDVEYEKDGKNLRMTVAEDGTVLKDNR